jgi:hypothetical protein
MFASIVRTTLLLAAQAPGMPGVDDEADADLLTVLALGFVVFGLLWLLIRFMPSAEKLAPPSRRTSRAPAPTKPQRQSVSAARPIPRRVIQLHAQTPGQSQHEYNVGDLSGTRASALIRLA